MPTARALVIEQLAAHSVQHPIIIKLIEDTKKNVQRLFLHLPAQYQSAHGIRN